MSGKDKNKEYHNAYNRARRKRSKELGMCQSCHTKRPAKQRTICKDCLLDRRYNSKARHKLSPKYKEMLKNGVKCEICKIVTKKPNLDHDHKKNKDRGVLCNNCNKALGFLKDEIKVVKSALKYLEKYK